MKRTGRETKTNSVTLLLTLVTTRRLTRKDRVMISLDGVTTRKTLLQMLEARERHIPMQLLRIAETSFIGVDGGPMKIRIERYLLIIFKNYKYA